MRKLSLVFVVFAATTFAHAGGPAHVAGASYFDPAVKGTPLTWANGAVTYYTDQGNLSALLPGPSADAFVASAFASWTSIPTAAVSALHAGQLAEDVSGANVALSANALGMPFDILPSAVATPVAIVYDADGSVTDALLAARNGAVGRERSCGVSAYVSRHFRRCCRCRIGRRREHDGSVCRSTIGTVRKPRIGRHTVGVIGPDLHRDIGADRSRKTSDPARTAVPGDVPNTPQRDARQ